MTELDEDLRTMFWVVNSVFAILATITVLARFTARKRKVRSIAFGADDWLICVALVLNWAMYALAGRGVFPSFPQEKNHIGAFTSLH